MARLVTCGFEGQQLSATANAAEGEGFLDSNFATLPCIVDTTTVRSGAASLKVNTDSSANIQAVHWTFTGALDVTYYARCAAYFTANPVTNDSPFLNFLTAGLSSRLQLIRKTTGVVVLRVLKAGSLTTISDSVAVSLNQWHVFEVQMKITTAGTTGTASARIDGTLVSISAGEGGGTQWTGDLGTTTLGALRVGKTSGANQGGNAYYIEDVALNDDTGANQTSWCNDSRFVLLKSASDNARVGFTGGAGGTTNLYDAEDNVPPVGVVLASATDTSQIKDATNNATDTYDANLQTYLAAGVPAGAQIIAVQAIAQGGNSTTTSRTIAVNTQSNPGPGTEGTLATGTTAAASTPTGWKTVRNTIAYSPSVTLGTAPVVRVRKGTASTDSTMYDLLGLYVEYVLNDTIVAAVASATASAPTPTVTITVTSPVGAATATALPPSPSLAVTTTVAATTASSPTPTVGVSVTAPAGDAAASAPAPRPTVTVTTVGSAAASAPTPAVIVTDSDTAPPAHATADAAAPTVIISVSPAAAPSTASAAGATPTVTVTAPTASATATASAPAPAVSVTDSDTAPPAHATADAAAPTVLISFTAPVAGGTAAAPTPTVTITVTAPAASASASAAASVSVTDGDTAPPASATASAPAPIVQITATAPPATATASAPAPTLSISGVLILAPAATATADGNAPDPRILAQAVAALATASGAAPTPLLVINPSAASGTASALARVITRSFTYHGAAGFTYHGTAGFGYGGSVARAFTYDGADDFSYGGSVAREYTYGG